MQTLGLPRGRGWGWLPLQSGHQPPCLPSAAWSPARPLRLPGGHGQVWQQPVCGHQPLVQRRERVWRHVRRARQVRHLPRPPGCDPAWAGVWRSGPLPGLGRRDPGGVSVSGQQLEVWPSRRPYEWRKKRLGSQVTFILKIWPWSHMRSFRRMYRVNVPVRWSPWLHKWGGWGPYSLHRPFSLGWHPPECAVDSG